MSLRAKVAAFRYAMEQKGTSGTSLGDIAYNWIMASEPPYQNAVQADFTLSPYYNRWMVTGFAIINYCQAYDMLNGSGHV